MGLDFRIRDFAYPISILRLKNLFERNQWLPEEILREYQTERLRTVIEHAYRNVPYYSRIFKENNLVPSDIKTLSDLKVMPFLTKNLLRENFCLLTAINAKRYNPQLLSTSGTTGGPVKFYADKNSNILEFVYYWRFWGWAGYTLGDTFAELSAQFFTPYAKKKNRFYHFEHITRRLIVNSLLISSKNADEYIRLFNKFRPKFLKGLPSNLYILALVLNIKKNHGIKFKAVFSQGENLLAYQKKMIESTFACKVFDSYGHMERTVSISQCLEGVYHVHLDYGVTEFSEIDIVNTDKSNSDEYVAEIIGTSLHNFSMPLLRYKTGDLVRLSRIPRNCFCKRTFPVVISILGRDCDVVITPEGRAITALYVALDRTPGITFGQIIQEERNRLLVKVAYSSRELRHYDSVLINNLRDFVGDSLEIEIKHVDPEEVRSCIANKHKVIISKIFNPGIFT